MNIILLICLIVAALFARVKSVRHTTVGFYDLSIHNSAVSKRVEVAIFDHRFYIYY